MFLIVHILQVGEVITQVRFLENTIAVSCVVVRYNLYVSLDIFQTIFLSKRTWQISNIPLFYRNKVLTNISFDTDLNRIMHKAPPPPPPPPTLTTDLQLSNLSDLWRHQMEEFFALLITGEFPSQRPVAWSFDFFYLRLNQPLSEQWRRCWSVTYTNECL